MGQPRQHERASIQLDFADPAAAVAWFEEAQHSGLIPERAALFQSDALDATVPAANQLIVRASGDGRGRQVRVDEASQVTVTAT